jgi:hypothetical protein
MNTGEGPWPATRDAAEAPPPRPGGGTLWRWFWRLAVAAAIVVALAVGAFILAVVSLSNSYKAPQGVTAPVLWTTSVITVSPEAPVAIGSLALTGGPVPTTGLRVGVNAGAAAAPPASDPGRDPGSVLNGSVVRVTATAQLSPPQSCLAPCELQIPGSFDCEDGTCTMTVEVKVELIAEAPGTRDVVVRVAGGASAAIDAALPLALAVDLQFGTAGPRAP